MKAEHIELVIEFGVILLSPVIHTLYLQYVKKVEAEVIKQNLRLFLKLYALFAIAVLLIFFSFNK
jgi:hypothetical protein